MIIFLINYICINDQIHVKQIKGQKTREEISNKKDQTWGVPISGTIISGRTVIPWLLTETAAWKIARACISVSSGYEIPSLFTEFQLTNIRKCKPNTNHQSYEMDSYLSCTSAQHKHRHMRTNLQPRKPSMGFTSDNFSILEKISSSFIPVSEVSSLTMCSRSPSGRNSWSGGSNNRIVTGRPSIARKIPSKSDLW